MLLKCPECGQRKTRKQFYRRYRFRDGLWPVCLDCRKQFCACGCGQLTTGYISYRTGEVPQFITGHHNRLKKYKKLAATGRKVGVQLGHYQKSEAWKRYMSKVQSGENNPMYGKFEHMRTIASHLGRTNPRFGKDASHGKGQWVIDRKGRRIWFRSSWEVKVAIWLDDQGLTWNYEKERFDLGLKTYKSDFWIEEWGCFWEIKGWFHNRHQKTIQLFREKYPRYPLVVTTLPVMRLIFGEDFR